MARRDMTGLGAGRGGVNRPLPLRCNRLFTFLFGARPKKPRTESPRPRADAAQARNHMSTRPMPSGLVAGHFQLYR